MNRLDELKQQLSDIRTELEAFEAQQQPAEWPQVGDIYYAGAYLDGALVEYKYAGDLCDNFLKSIGDMHRTKEEALAYRAYRMNPRTVMRDRIQQFVDEYNGGECGYWTVTDLGSITETVVATPLGLKNIEGVELLNKKFGLPNILWACGWPEPGGE